MPVREINVAHETGVLRNLGDWPSENKAVTSGKGVEHRMKKSLLAIAAVLGIFTDLGPSELLEKPL
jgi:hypothetical protein